MILLTATWCGYCRKQRADFLAAGLAYAEFDVETDQLGRRLYEALPTPRGVPVIIVADEWKIGYGEGLGAHLLRVNPQLAKPAAANAREGAARAPTASAG